MYRVSIIEKYYVIGEILGMSLYIQKALVFIAPCQILFGESLNLLLSEKLYAL